MKFRVIVLVLCAALAFAVAGCGSSSDDPSSPSSKRSGSTETSGSEEAGESTESAGSSKAGSSKKKTKPTVTIPKQISPTKFATQEVEEGSGPEAKDGDRVAVQYVGVGYDSEEEFDTSWGFEPYTFTLGAGEVIKGWDRGVKGMKVGGRREVLVPAALAYGAAGSPPKIAPNEALVFAIDLLSIE